MDMQSEMWSLVAVNSGIHLYTSQAHRLSASQFHTKMVRWHDSGEGRKGEKGGSTLSVRRYTALLRDFTGGEQEEMWYICFYVAFCGK